MTGKKAISKAITYGSLAKKMASKKSPTFEDYLAGGFLGFGLTMIQLVILFSFIDFKMAPLTVRVIAILLPCTFGGMVSGYLIARRATYNYVKVGLKVSLSSFIITMITNIILFQTVEGGLWILMGFLLGGYLGITLNIKILRR
ncbi:MAG: hypothetical protein AOA65_0261 [Candidatus Bathyarchaeota archaeon BA1]|nr:MAG: hypothetical protein AOA65_0261 [Candidatus Bathyarchaeota archaeon BA1]